MMDFDVLLVDIEGTTTSISFVKDVLFPYARTEAEKYLRANWQSDKVQEDVNVLRKQAALDIENGLEGTIPIPEGSVCEIVPKLVSNVRLMIDQDRKVTALKQLQGHIWTDGYKSGVLRGHVYKDVKPAFERLLAAQKKIYVYSSGSEEAQKLLFGHSEEGDMLHFFSGHFDTKVGLKGEPASYRAISEAVGVPPAKILFLTDIVKEAAAAKEVGLLVRLVSRHGNTPVTTQDILNYGLISSFHDLFL